ncbi:hypothetical protein PM082_004612 [Marasmius tenuissimus]|nr:hypothetical protein PM082_004612 [Marasmius tenuissimus]
MRKDEFSLIWFGYSLDLKVVKRACLLGCEWNGLNILGIECHLSRVNAFTDLKEFRKKKQQHRFTHLQAPSPGLIHAAGEPTREWPNQYPRFLSSTVHHNHPDTETRPRTW